MVQEEHDEMLVLLCNFLIHYLRNTRASCRKTVRR